MAERSLPVGRSRPGTRKKVARNETETRQACLVAPPPSPKSRATAMGAIRQRGTAPELVVREALTDLGYRYRCNVRTLPGSPDIANKRKRFAVFVHGCFWHRHTLCRRSSMPKSNVEFWLAKFQANVRRDARNRRLLESRGFRVLVVWECDAMKVESVKHLLRKQLP